MHTLIGYGGKVSREDRNKFLELFFDGLPKVSEEVGPAVRWNGSWNGSCEAMGGHSVPRLAAMWVSCLLILAANLSLVAALLCARAHLLSQRQNVFILGLALADLAVGLSLPAQAYRGRIDLIFAGNSYLLQ